MENEKGLKYGLYTRKSTESDERQILSIESQIKEMKQIAEKENLEIKEIYEEKHSAKFSRSRQLFTKLLSDINNEIIDSIIVWSPDRLSRNAGDLGDLVDLMDMGKLCEIRTYNQVFTNSPNHKFLLMILCSQAKLENDNRAINIKRGIRNRYSQGWRPGPAPIGYLNLKIGSEAKIVIDDKKAPFVRQIFEKVALDKMKVIDLVIWVYTNTPLRTETGSPLAKSTIYYILRHPFYYGKLPYKGEILEGSHPHIIEKELFDKVQANLKPFRKGNWKHRSKISIANFVRCGGCDGTIIENYHRRKLKSGIYRMHVYFRCSKFKDANCHQLSVGYYDMIKQMANLMVELDLSNIVFSEEIQKDILNYSLIRTIISTQNLRQHLILLRAENQTFFEVE